MVEHENPNEKPLSVQLPTVRASVDQADRGASSALPELQTAEMGHGSRKKKRTWNKSTSWVNQYIGLTYNRVTILGISSSQVKGKHLRVDCACSCGVKFTADIHEVKNGHTKSCGCLRFEPKNIVHGERHSPEYAIRIGMLRRCYNPNSQDWENYGGRGIAVCERWKESIVNFIADMGRRPPGSSIERIDNSGDYEPSNCRWATRREQCNNKRSSRLITAFARTQTIAEWSRETKTLEGTIWSRLRAGHSPEVSVTNTPLKCGPRARDQQGE
jgi:hypothetical protein